MSSEVLSLIVGIGYAVAFVIYNRKIFEGKIVPNGSTWAIWSIVSLVSTPSYLMASGDLWKSMIPLLNILLCIATFVVALIYGKFKDVYYSDYGVLFLSLIAVCIWIFTGSPTKANMAINSAILAGFLPTWLGIWRGTTKEQALPWWIWTASYILAVVVVIMRWRGQWIDMLYPGMCVILHASVPILSSFHSLFLRTRRPNPTLT